MKTSTVISFALLVAAALAAPQDCPKGCPKIYQPVCGQNVNGVKRQFGNSCEMKVAECTENTHYTQLSLSDCEERCNTACPDIYKPVCGQDTRGVTKKFPSYCDMKSAECLDKTEYTRVDLDECNRAVRSVQNDDCPRFCADMYKPVCAIDSIGTLREFPSPCEMKIAACKTRTHYTEVGINQCKECPKGCPRIYEPVCGQTNMGDKRKFSNSCEMRVAECDERIFFSQLSVEECEDNCPMVCPNIYIPVCGQDSIGNKRPFESPCDMEVAACRERTHYTEIDFDECLVTYASPVEEECPKFCPFIYQPVCGKDGTGFQRQFVNPCEMRVSECRERTHYTQVEC